MSYGATTNIRWQETALQIETMLSRRGATGFVRGTRGLCAVIAFEYKGRAIQYRLPLPDPANKEFTHLNNGKARAATAAEALWNRARNGKWRALYLIIKAKLEACDAGVTTIEEEFLAHTVTPSGQTVGEIVIPQLASGGPVRLALPGDSA